MKNFVKLVFLFSLLLVLVQSCTGSKEVLLNETPEVSVVTPSWQEIVPGQEDGKKMMVVFLPVANELENYAVDSIYFKGYHQNLTYKSKSSSGAGYQAVITLESDKEAIEPPYEILEDQALISYFDENKARRYFKVSDIKQAESIYMP